MPVSTASGHTVEAFRVSDHGHVRVGDDYPTRFGDANNCGGQIGHNTGSVTNTFNLSSLGKSLSSHCLSKAAQRIDLTYRILSVSHSFITFDCHPLSTRPRLCASRCARGGVAMYEGARSTRRACRTRRSRVRSVVGDGTEQLKNKSRKSQLAIEYAYRVREAEPQTWVFWVHASSVARFQDSYRGMAERLQLPGWNDPKVDVLGMVYRWLSNEDHGRWTMVLDNADNRDVVFGPWSGEISGQAATPSRKKSMSDYLPITSNGSIVVTSRNREVLEGLDIGDEDMLDVGPMEVDVAQALLSRKLKRAERESVSEDGMKLVQELDCIPLAIAQAAAYINQRTPRVTVSRYLELLVKDDIEKTKLLAKGIRDPRRDDEASNSVIATWYMSFEHIRQTRRSAAQLLSLMSLFDREGIPDDLLQGQYLQVSDEEAKSKSEEEESNSNAEDDDEDKFEDDVAMLRAYHLIHVGVNKNVFDMHRLVQFSTKSWLSTHHQLVTWQEVYIKLMGAAYPTGDYRNWLRCKALFPHAQMVLLYEAPSVICRKARDRALYNGAWYGLESGQYVMAEKMARSCLRSRELRIISDGSLAFNAMGMLGRVLQYQGKYDEAEEMKRRALEGCEKVLGKDHPNTLTSVSNLASVLQDQGKYNDAEEMDRRALKGYEKVLGKDHPNTMISVDNLASVLRHQGKYDEAEEMSRRALEGSEKVLGVDHPDTLISVDNLASGLQDQGKYDEAEEMNRRALKGYEKVLGKDYPSTLISVNNLASVLRCQGKYDEAETMHRRALKGREKVLESDHPSTLISVHNLASVLRCQGKYNEAETIHRRALKEREKVLGPNHPDTLTSVNNLALVLQDQGRYDDAEEMSQRALEGSEKVLGVDHPATLTSVDNLALVLQHQGKYDDAEEMSRRALAGREKVLGSDHPSTLISVHNRASVLRCQGKYNEAETIHRRALKEREKVLGPNHPDTLTSVNNLALVLQDQGRYDDAEEMKRRALEGREKVLGVDHPDTLTSIYCLAHLLDARDEHHEALALYQRASSGFVKVLGVDHPTTLACQKHQETLLKSVRAEPPSGDSCISD